MKNLNLCMDEIPPTMSITMSFFFRTDNTIMSPARPVNIRFIKKRANPTRADL